MKQNRERFGILYAATGHPWLDEAVRSAESCKARMQDVPIALFTDRPAEADSSLFDHVYGIDEPSYSYYDKIEPLTQTPFERTLFLDSDTLVIEPVYELAALLDRFDLAYCHAPMRYGEHDFPGCNEGFPQGNTGVILYQFNSRVISFFEAWAGSYRTHAEGHAGGDNSALNDQPSFRETIYESDLRFTILPCEYNLRTNMPYFAGGRARVKILHGRDPELSAVAATVNNTLWPRISGPGIAAPEYRD